MDFWVALRMRMGTYFGLMSQTLFLPKNLKTPDTAVSGGFFFRQKMNDFPAIEF